MRTRVAIVMVVILALGLGSGIPYAHADEARVVTVQKNSTLVENTPDTNFSGSTLAVQTVAGGFNSRAILQFNVSKTGPLGDTLVIKAGTMTLSVANPPGESRTHTVRVIHDATFPGPGEEPDWVVSQVTWNNRATFPLVIPWVTPGGDPSIAFTDMQGLTTGSTSVTFSVNADSVRSEIPQRWRDGRLPNKGLLIIDEDAPSGGSPMEYTNDTATLDLSIMDNPTIGGGTIGPSSINGTYVFTGVAGDYTGSMITKIIDSAVIPSTQPSDGTVYIVGNIIGNTQVIAYKPDATDLIISDENGADSVAAPGTTVYYLLFSRDDNAIAGAASATGPYYSGGLKLQADYPVNANPALKNWSYLTNGGATLAPPSPDPGNIVIAGDNSGKMNSMQSATGARNYQPGGLLGMTGGPVQSRSPIISALDTTVDCDAVAAGQQPCDVVYSGSADGFVYAHNANTGELIWQSQFAPLGDAIQGAPAVQVKKFSSPCNTRDFDLVIVGTRNDAPDTTDNKVVALNGNTGEIVWFAFPGNMDIVSGSPFVDLTNCEVWVASRAGALGTQPSIWRMSTEDGGTGVPNFITPITLGLTDNDVDMDMSVSNLNTFAYVVTQGGDLVAIERATGTIFSTNIGVNPGVGVVSAVAQGSTDELYFSTTGGVHKRIFDRVAKTFSAGWDNTTDVGNPSSPVFLPISPFDGLFVGSLDGLIHKLNPATGAQVLTRTVNAGATTGAPALDLISNLIYIGDTSGRIYCFDLF